MPRKARKVSNTKIYHIILRGNDKQDIFFEEQDYKKFIKEISNTKEKYKYELFAYCLMTNHVHLILFDKNDNLSKTIQSLSVSYSSYFSKKYDKIGHLFQNRFFSKCVETREYLIQLCRYIHQNPVKAEICKNPKNYYFSSYNEYFKTTTFVDCNYVFAIIKKDDFIKLHKQKVSEQCLEIEDKSKVRVTDEQAQKIIEKCSKCKNATEFQALNIKLRNKCLKKFKESGLSIRQISRLTGVSYYLIQKI